MTLEVGPGAVVSVSGANGCGKSTLLRIAAGLVAPTYGDAERPARFALVPDRFTPPQRMTAGRYLRHHARMRGLDARTAERRVAELSSQLGIAPGPDVELSRLSQGNARKVQVAQAFLAPSGLVLLDEVAGVLDERGVAAVDELVDEAARAGAAVVLSRPDRDAGPCYHAPPPPGRRPRPGGGGRVTATAAVRFALASSVGSQRWVALTATFAAADCPLHLEARVGSTVRSIVALSW